MRRIFAVLSVMAVMAAMLAASVVPAFAADPPQSCFGQDRATYASTFGGTAQSQGFHSSQRKGANSDINHAYMNGCSGGVLDPGGL